MKKYILFALLGFALASNEAFCMKSKSILGKRKREEKENEPNTLEQPDSKKRMSDAIEVFGPRIIDCIIGGKPSKLNKIFLEIKKLYPEIIVKYLANMTVTITYSEDREEKKHVVFFTLQKKLEVRIKKALIKVFIKNGANIMAPCSDREETPMNQYVNLRKSLRKNYWDLFELEKPFQIRRNGTIFPLNDAECPFAKFHTPPQDIE